MNSKKRVAVFMGGPSSEHEISVKSGERVFCDLDRKQYEPFKVFIDREGNWDIVQQELKKQADLAFIALHGAYGEDGTIQDILEEIKVPYTGSGVHASALGMNKYLSLQLFRDHGIITPISLFVSKHEWNRNPFKVFTNVRYYTGYPLVVKPNDGGASVGILIAHNQEELRAALENVFMLSRGALVQNYISGREFTCGVVDHGSAETAFPLLPTEILKEKDTIFDYEKKTKAGHIEHRVVSHLLHPVMRSLQKVALYAHRLLGARGISRTDMMVDEKGNIVVLEINTIPGLSEESLLPKAAEASGISFSNLLDIIISSASKR